MLPQVVAAGFIVFRTVSCQIQYLLLQASDAVHHWTPPKGHVDAGESELETAYRETAEEAGLLNHHLQLIDGFKKVLHYQARGKPKAVHYWLAQLRDPDTPVIISSEHQQFAWFPLDAAVQNAAYPDMQEVLRDADSFIQAHVNVT